MRISFWLSLILCLPLGAQDILMIVHPTNEAVSVSRNEIQKIYLNKKVRWGDGSRIVPVTLQVMDIQALFLKQNILKTPRQFSTFWKRQFFTGKGVPPTTFANEDDVVSFVARTPGGIGFVSRKASLNGVRLLAIRKNSS